jgi:hypothetical protein
MKLNIKLGSSSDLAPCGCPVDQPRDWYPTIHFETPEELELPKEGTMTVKFRKVESAERERGEKEVYSCTVEVRELVSVDSSSVEPPARSHSRETEDALDSLRAKKMEED